MKIFHAVRIKLFEAVILVISLSTNQVRNKSLVTSSGGGDMTNQLETYLRKYGYLDGNQGNNQTSFKSALR